MNSSGILQRILLFFLAICFILSAHQPSEASCSNHGFARKGWQKSTGTLQLSMARPKPDFANVAVSDMKVTEGSIKALDSGKLQVSAPAMRAYAVESTPPESLLRFRYLGPTTAMKKLASGRERRQIGLKLQAEDACNLIYVMYRIAPEAALTVQLKLNPGKQRSNQCGNGGYTTIASYALKPETQENSRHEILARFDGDMLHVILDGTELIKVELPAEARRLRGKLGLRSDNGIFEAELLRPTPEKH